MHDDAILHPARRKDMGRHPAEHSNEMRVVNVQVDGGPPGLRSVGNRIGPVGPCDNALKLSCQQSAISINFDGVR